MRFMIIVKGNKDTEAGTMPPEIALRRDGELPRGAGEGRACCSTPRACSRRQRASRIKFSGGKRTVIDGPFTESKELIAGYTLIQVKTREEAMEWARRFPAPHGPKADAEIEVRQLFELDDFTPSEAIDRFGDWAWERRSRDEDE